MHATEPDDQMFRATRGPWLLGICRQCGQMNYLPADFGINDGVKFVTLKFLELTDLLTA